MGKSIALFGTSADPPTKGHKKILEELSKIYDFTIGYVSNNPNKNHKEDISIRSHLLKTLIEDLENLIQQWENILKVSENSNPPKLIKRDDDFSLKILRDHIKESTKSIIIDSKFSVERAKDFLTAEIK